MRDLKFWKAVVVINAAVPLALLAWDAAHGQLGANAVNFALHTTGILSLLFLLLSLTVTPLRLLTGWNALISFRRALGLFGFFYACLHLGIYFVFDRALSFQSTVNEILMRQYLQVGFAAIVLLTPLAITSTNAMLSRLGARNWKRLHRLAYVATGLGALHYFMLVKADVRQPLAFAGVLAVLLAARFVWHYFDLRKASRRPAATTPPAANRKFWSGELVVARVFVETPEVRTFRFVSPDGQGIPFDYQPGQYMNIQLNIDGRRVNRSYTIASSPTRGGYCELSIKREPSGLASSHIHEHLHEGDRLRISAPAGKFVFTGEGSDSVVLIAGGVGITPLMSITRYLTDRGWKGEIFLLLVARAECDIIFKDELDLLQRRFPNLHVCVTLTRVEPTSAWSGHRGRVSQEWIRKCVPDLQRKPVYLCGPDEMMTATRELLIAMGVPKERIHIEAFVSPGVALRSQEPADISSNSSFESATVPAQSGSWSMNGRPADINGTTSTATFVRSGKSAELTSDTTILEAAESAGVELPFECRSGICGQCKVKLTRGTVTMEVEEAISSSEKKAGWVLACQSRSRVDVTVDA